MFLEQVYVGVVIPAYQAEQTIRSVLESVPPSVRTIVVVADGCHDETAKVVEEASRLDPRIILVVHEANRGVGAAMRTGYRRALEEGADVIVKMDSDGQMDPAYLPNLVFPIVAGLADYTKGNRFLRPDAIHRMPKLRLLGNAALSFVSKLSSGYWNVLDPTNGYTAISREAVTAIDLAKVDDRFFFESSMLIELGTARAVVADVAIPSRYEGAPSHLSAAHSLVSFALKHARHFLRRMFYRYLLTDFSPVSLLLFLSLPLMAFGLGFGIRRWMLSSIYGVPATAGTVMLAAFTLASGIFCLVQAMIYDIMSTPQRPLTLPRVVLARPKDYRELEP